MLPEVVQPVVQYVDKANGSALSNAEKGGEVGVSKGFCLDCASVLPVHQQAILAEAKTRRFRFRIRVLTGSKV